LKISPIEVTLIGHFGSDLNVVNAARVSFEKASDWDYSWIDDFNKGLRDTMPEGNVLKEGDKKLISYLAKHKHFSPFNHAFLSFRVKAPIFVARQLVKHKFMPWNEVSRRYVDSEPEFFVPEVFRKKAENVKQGSGEEYFGGSNAYQHALTRNITEDCLTRYNTLLGNGVCPEQARMVLPQNTMTEWIWSGTLGAFADMLKLRLDPHAQKESRDVAELIYAQALPLFPVSLPALLENK
jgi:thymidylate synthase (FAD)